MKFAKAPRCLYDEIHAQRAYFAAFVQFAKQEDVNLHMKNLASFASLREIKSIHPEAQHKRSKCVFVVKKKMLSPRRHVFVFVIVFVGFRVRLVLIFNSSGVAIPI